MSAKVTLSTAQRTVVDYRGSDLQVIACAGSGKTESISRRIAGLVAEGKDPAAIIAFTFTERAATELKARITGRVADRMGADFLDRLGPMFVGTIHAYCFRVLQDHVPRFGNYDLLDENRHAGFLSREFYSIGLEKLRARHWAPIRDFARTVDVIANEFIPPNALAGTPLGECYAAYRQTLHRHHFLTFSQIITEALAALEDPSVLSRVRANLRYLFVDEYQDINPSQERLIELLAVLPVELTVVGDDDQSIYQWRGSDVRNIIEFRDRRGDSTSLELDENRRARPGIVAAANAFAQSIPGRLPKEMKPVRSDGPNQVVPWAAETDEREALRIVETIQRLKAIGYNYRDVAVLYRSVRTSAPPLRYCQVNEKLVDRPPRYWARASREPAMLGIKNGRRPQLDNTAWKPTRCAAAATGRSDATAVQTTRRCFREPEYPAAPPASCRDTRWSATSGRLRQAAI